MYKNNLYKFIQFVYSQTGKIKESNICFYNFFGALKEKYTSAK